MPASRQRRAEESEQWERACKKPAPPSHILANCSVGGLQGRSQVLGDTLRICLLNEGPDHGKGTSVLLLSSINRAPSTLTF